MDLDSRKSKKKSFKMLGEEFDSSYFPIIYAKYIEDVIGTELYIKSVADTWHGGNIVSATQALESDLGHEAAVIADAEATIQIPEQYADWYNKTVKMTRGPGGRLNIYKLDDYDKLLTTITREVTSVGLIENPQHSIGEMFEACSSTVDITDEGYLYIPENLKKHIVSLNDPRFECKDGKLVISRSLDHIKEKILDVLRESRETRTKNSEDDN